MAPVDCLETIIAYVGADPDLSALTDARVANKHRFALADAGAVRQGWPTPARALTLTYDGPDGEPDTAGEPMEKARLVARGYGGSALEAGRVINQLLSLARATTRQAVPLSDGRRALLYWLWPAEAPIADFDQDVRIDVVRVVLRAAVARDPLP